MKWTANESDKQKFDLTGFSGLVTDRDGDVWLITEHAFVCFESGEQPWASDAETRDQLEGFHGPFTKYNGKLVIEND